MSSSYQRTKMPPSAWMNGQYQQLGPTSQAFTQQALYLRDQQTGNMNSSCRYQTVNVGGQQAQNANLTFQDGANRQTPNWQTSVAQHQAASPQQPTGGKNNGYLQPFQNLNNNPQSGNFYLPFSNGTEVVNQQQLHHSSFPSSSNQTQHGMNVANAPYGQQDLSYWKQPANGNQAVHTQDGYIVLQQYKGQRAAHQNVNTDAMKTAQPYTTTGTGVLHKQTAGTSSSVSGTALKRQSVHPQNPRQTSAHDKLFSSLPPSYVESVVQLFGNTSNSLSSSQTFSVSNLNQRTPQYASQLNTVQNAGKQTFTCGDGVQKSYAAESNQTMQPNTSTVTQTYHLTTAQSLPYHHKQFMLETNHNSVLSGAQRVADGFSVTTTGSRNGSDKKADGDLSNRNLVGSSHHASLLAQTAEGILPQKNDAQSFVTHSQQSCDVHDHLQSMASCDGSLHASPGRTGTRAVAVVQPLSQETCPSGRPSPHNPSQFGECTTTDDSSLDSGKSCILPDVAKTHQAAYSGEDTEACSENANQRRSSDCPLAQSAASSKTVSSSSSPGRHTLLKKLLTSHVSESEQSSFLKACQNSATVAQQPVYSKVQESKQRHIDETPVDLSSVPTTPWTKDMLLKLVQDEEKFQKEIQNDAYANSTPKLLNMFWGSNTKMLLSHLKGYTAIIEEVNEFFHKHVTKNSVTLSQVKPGFGEALKKYHVLKHTDVYTAPPYKSAWLNVNQQLDDIDKEFGFPWSLKCGHDTLESGRQPDQNRPVDNIPAQTVIEITGNVSKSAPVDSGDGKQASTLVTTSNKSLSPNETGSAVSSEPYYSFNIEVLPPEEAKRIFQQVQSRKQQSVDMDSQPGEVMNSSLEGQMHKVSDIPVIDSLVENTPKVVCCVARALETVGGSRVPFSSKCQCKKEDRSQVHCAEEATATQKNDEVFLIESDTNIHSAFKKEMQVISCTPFSRPEPCSEEIIDLTEDDSSLYFAEDLNNISYESISDSQSSASENKGTELKSAGSSPSRSSNTSQTEIEQVLSSDVANRMSNDEEDRAQAERTSTDAMESMDSPHSTPQMDVASSPQTVALHGEHGTAEQPLTRAKSPDLKPVPKGLDFKKDYVDVPDGKHPTTKTVELLLFGSSPQKKLPGRGTTAVTFQSGKTAPKVLSVKVGSLMTKDPVDPGACSVKQRIHEEWRRSFPPINMTLKKVKKRKSEHGSVSEMRFKVAQTSWTSGPTEPPASSGNRTWNKNIKLSLKRRRSLSNGRKMRVDKTGNVVTCGLPADEAKGNAEVEGDTCPPGKKFRVSPQSFLLSG